MWCCVSTCTLVLLLCYGLIKSSAGSVSLLPSGDVYTCQGDVQVFTCLQFMQHARIEWLIHFERSLSESDVEQSYVPSDPVGEIQTDHRDGFMFIFNLTSSSSLGLASTLTVVVDTNSRNLINVVIVSCFQGNSTILHIHNDPPATPTNLRISEVVLLQWNPSEVADQYFVIVSPTIVPTSVFTTTNTSIYLPLLFNLAYNISVMASNCAGNSTPAQIIIPSFVECDNPLTERILQWISDTCSREEGSTIDVHCSSDIGSSNTLDTSVTCVSEGKWKQFVTTTVQDNYYHKGNHSKTLHSVDTTICILFSTTISGVTFALGLLVGMLLNKCAIRLRARKKTVHSIPPDTTQIPEYEEVPRRAPGDHMLGLVNYKVDDNVAYYGPI